MRSRTIVVAGLVALLAAGVGAQEPSRVTATEEMVESASALLATVAGGPGGTETLLGFDKGKNLALAARRRGARTTGPTGRRSASACRSIS